MAFHDNQDDSRHSSVSDDGSNPSAVKTLRAEKDELAISHRGASNSSGCNSSPSTKQNQSITTTSGTSCSPSNMAQPTTRESSTSSIEDQLNRLSSEEKQKSWQYLDSVHANSKHRAFGGQYLGNNNSNNSNNNNSMWKNNNSETSLAMEDSCASFDTFGGSDSGEFSDSAEFLAERAAFCSLEPEVTPRRKVLATRTPTSNRLMRAPSNRLSNLQLISEDD